MPVKKFLMLAIMLLVSTNFVFSQEEKQNEKATKNSKTAKKKEPKTFTDFISEDAVSDQGVFNVHQVEDKIYYEIPSKVLGKDMLIVSRIAQLPANVSPYLNAGSKVGEQVVRWVKEGDQIFIKIISYSNIADEQDPIHLSVRQNNLEPIAFAFEILVPSTDSSGTLIQVNELFEKDVRFLSGMSDSNRKRFKVSRLDNKRSFIDTIQAFPKNIEVKHTMTYAASSPPSNARSATITMQMNQSMILLPEELMQTRVYDERVGWFNLSHIDYSTDALKSEEKSVIRRWNLVPKDQQAYLRGELVEPENPIIYYLDPATPKKWRPYFIKGIEDWQSLFELAGFKNAIIAKEAPSYAEDPEFSPEDIRYSTVRYVASTTRNATGPSVSDPRTGEILESDVIWYHNHLRSYRNRYLLETGAANKKARSLDTPDEEIGEMMRMVIAHEVGHALGLPHNMKASAAYPTDSLRSGSFTQKMGIAASIMDYARYNYVAQPGDENIRFIRQLGPYDAYAINWGYRWYGPDVNAEQEKEILKGLIEEKGDDPIYQFGGRGLDPDSQTECIGDNAVTASNYGISNLKIVQENLELWVNEDGANYDDLKELHGELLGVWRRYLGHVSTNIGGVHKVNKRVGQEGSVYEVVDKRHQQAAMQFMKEQVFETPNWLIDTALFNKIDETGTLARINNIQIGQLHRLLSDSRMKLLLEQVALYGDKTYSPLDLMADLHASIWAELSNGEEIDYCRRQLQSAYVHRLISFIGEEGQKNKTHPDVSAIALMELINLEMDLSKSMKLYQGMSRSHVQSLITKINVALAN